METKFNSTSCKQGKVKKGRPTASFCSPYIKISTESGKDDHDAQ